MWRLRRRGRWLYLPVLLEFQSTDEPRMALRILTYTSLLYQELVRNDALDARGRLPVVLPVVLYTGEARTRGPRRTGRVGNSEIDVVVPVPGGVPVAVRGTQALRFIVPRAAPQHPAFRGRLNAS